MNSPGVHASSPNGAALAAFLSAGIGAFALGLLVILNESRIFVSPTLYGPSGGVSGRTTFAAVIWLLAWAQLHRRWTGRQIESTRVFPLSLALIGIAILLCFPPLWKLF